MSKKSSKPVRVAIPADKASILGVGLDNQDGHRRITTGEQFTLVGGSQETHERMTETMVKTFEELKKRDQRLETVEPKELTEIVLKSTPQ